MEKIKNYIFTKVTGNTELQTLLSDGAGGYDFYVPSIPTGKEFETGMAASILNAPKNFPTIEAYTVQFNIFSKLDTNASKVFAALADLFDQNRNDTDGTITIVASKQTDGGDLPRDVDTGEYHQFAVYNFIVR